MEIRIGLYNKAFQMASKKILEEKTCDIRGYKAVFNLVAGPLVSGAHTLEDTYILEINYEDSEKEHRKKLPLGGWNSHLCPDYAKEANELASKFLEEKGFSLVNHFNSWPEFQALIAKNPKKKRA